ncbi:MAG: lysophospholipid acyltransferase family protein [Sphaerochaetaceae bacterium]
MTGFEKLQQAKRFDMQKRPIRQRQFLRPLTWILSYPEVWKHHLKINRTRMEGIKPPFLLLCTHMAFIDFKVTTAALFPYRANYVVAIDGFLKREWLLRNAGGICKRKFTNDLQLVRHIRNVLVDNKDVLSLYPEARYSLVGTTAPLPDSLGKMAKLLRVPVVMLNMHGHYLNSPAWNLKKRGNRIEADLSLLFSPEELKQKKTSEINQVIRQAFHYDEYAWQKEQQIRIDHPKRAEGLHKPLYQCPHCLAEYKMYSNGTILGCTACHKQWEMSEYGEMIAVQKAEDETSLITEFSHIPDWYEWEREQVRQAIETGTYFFQTRASVEALPNAKGFIPLGEVQLTHTMEGFSLEGTFNGKPFFLVKPALSMYACHIEYEYFGKGDCLDLSTLEDTFYIYPHGTDFSVTKLSLATEELFSYHRCAADHFRERIAESSASLI